MFRRGLHLMIGFSWPKTKTGQPRRRCLINHGPTGGQGKDPVARA